MIHANIWSAGTVLTSKFLACKETLSSSFMMSQNRCNGPVGVHSHSFFAVSCAPDSVMAVCDYLTLFLRNSACWWWKRKTRRREIFFRIPLFTDFQRFRNISSGIKKIINGTPPQLQRVFHLGETCIADEKCPKDIQDRNWALFHGLATMAHIMYDKTSSFIFASNFFMILRIDWSAESFTTNRTNHT